MLTRKGVSYLLYLSDSPIHWSAKDIGPVLIGYPVSTRGLILLRRCVGKER